MDHRLCEYSAYIRHITVMDVYSAVKSYLLIVAAATTAFLT